MPLSPEERPYTQEDVERVAKVLHAYHHEGCVSWHDTTDTATTGDEESRRRTLDEASRALDALFSTGLWLRLIREEAERLNLGFPSASICSTLAPGSTTASLRAKLSALLDQGENG